MTGRMTWFAAAALLIACASTIVTTASATSRFHVLTGATLHGAASVYRGRPWPGWSGAGFGWVGPGGGRGWFGNGWGWRGVNGYATPLYVSARNCGRHGRVC
jgi:hypothetical protein